MDIISEILSPDYVDSWEIALLAEKAKVLFGQEYLLLVYNAYLAHPAEIRLSLNAITEAIRIRNREELETILKKYYSKKDLVLAA